MVISTPISGYLDWIYRTFDGISSFLIGHTRPGIPVTKHQFESFSTDPKVSHGITIKRIVNNLIGTDDQGIIFRPKSPKGIECFVHADFTES